MDAINPDCVYLFQCKDYFSSLVKACLEYTLSFRTRPMFHFYKNILLPSSLQRLACIQTQPGQKWLGLMEETKWTQDENYCIREQLNFEKEQSDLLKEYFLKEFWFITALCWTEVFSVKSLQPTFISFFSLFFKLPLVCVHIVFHIEYNRTHYISLFAYVEQSRCWRQCWKISLHHKRNIKGSVAGRWQAGITVNNVSVVFYRPFSMYNRDWSLVFAPSCGWDVDEVRTFLTLFNAASFKVTSL